MKPFKFRFGVAKNTLLTSDGDPCDPSEIAELFEWWLNTNVSEMKEGEVYEVSLSQDVIAMKVQE